MKSTHSCLYTFDKKSETFHVENPMQFNSLYFPLANEGGLLSSISPNLHGDIKLDQHTFLTPPVALEDLHLVKTARNFWVEVSSKKDKKKPTLWALNGLSPWQKKGTKEDVSVQAGLLWHEMTRSNERLGLSARVLNFAPSKGGTFEIMMVEVTNTSRKSLQVKGTSAIPLYGRSADNLRDHRHVTALLNRIKATKYGLRLDPTMSFNESGHHVNETSYFVAGCTGTGKAPVGFFPTVASFVGPAGDLESPAALLEQVQPHTKVNPNDQGKEAMGALQFDTQTLRPKESATFILFLGITDQEKNPDDIVKEYNRPSKINRLLKETKAHWKETCDQIVFKTGDPFFNQWVRWVTLQPTLRKIYGNSFLPDFDYGRGGRGWRDLWQDCLALLLANPKNVRSMILNNFGGIRLDGSNATIIGRKKVEDESKGGEGFYWEPEFIADRNNVPRTWMDHGVWPFFTTELYIHQTGDWDILTNQKPYFRDAQLRRAKKLDVEWMRKESQEKVFTTKSGEAHEGTVLEHILVQLLIQFFNVGEHNMIRLEDADWNDGLDMASKRGESVAFSNFYAGCLESLANLLEFYAEKTGAENITLLKEVLLLIDSLENSVSYESIEEKKARMNQYFDALEAGVSGEKESIKIEAVVKDLKNKATWLKDAINKQEWLEENGHGWFNGYYDNKGRRVEGQKEDGSTWMTLTGQVYPILSSVASPKRAEKIVQSVNEHLWDHELGGIRLNSDFKDIQLDLGRAFSFAFGEKENGAIFSHMVVMYAYALYQTGLVDEAFRAFQSLFELAKNSKRSRIFPGLPEYFNNEGQGRYHYLTGSASWYVFTLLTQIYGVRGKGGDLILAPKLVPEQLDKKGSASVQFSFAGTSLEVIYKNPSKLDYARAAIKSIQNGKKDVPFDLMETGEALISRDWLKKNAKPVLTVTLGPKE